MLDNFLRVYPFYEVVKSPSESAIGQYEGKLPEFILEFWRRYGWGTFMNGYLRMIDPKEHKDFTDEFIKKVTLAIPLFPLLLQHLQI